MATIVERPEWQLIVKYIVGESDEITMSIKEWISSNPEEIRDLYFTYRQAVAFDTDEKLSQIKNKLGIVSK